MKNEIKNASKWKGFVISASLILAVLLIPMVIIFTFALCIPDQYVNTFSAELPDKLDRLGSVESPKIIVIGGSSVAFGLDSKLMEEKTGMPTVNFGLYASLGTRAMLDLSRDDIKEGDIVIISPETDKQTLSGYFGGEVMWQALERDLSKAERLSFDCKKEMFLSLWDYTSSKCRLYKNGTPNPEGVYRYDSFDSYGDISYPRPMSVMPLGYDPGNIITPSADIVGNDFIEIVNDYVSYAEKQGAKVYFTFAPMNSAAMSKDTTEESLYEYFRYLSIKLDCEIISDIRRSIIEPGYFYDSNFHLNDSGKTVWTANLCEDIRRVMGNNSPMDIELPKAPELPGYQQELSEDDPNSVYFTYIPILNSEGKTAWYSINGLTEEGKTQKELTIPESYNGIGVHSIEARAFKEGVLTDLTIPESIYSIVSGAFADCPTLSKLHMYNKDASTMIVDQMTLFEGANPAISIVLHGQDVYESYVTDYFWGNYAGKMVLVRNPDEK